MNKQQITNKIKQAGLKTARDSRKYIGGTCYELDFIKVDGSKFTFYNDVGRLGLYGDYDLKDETIFLDDKDNFIDLFNIFTPDDIKKYLPLDDGFETIDTAGDDLQNDLAHDYLPDCDDTPAIAQLI